MQSVEKILLSVVSMLAGTGFKNNMFFGEVWAAVKSSSGIIAIEKKQVFCRENKFRRCCLFERQKYKSILLLDHTFPAAAYSKMHLQFTVLKHGHYLC